MAKKPQHFKPSVSAETQFSRALRKVGRASGHIVEAHVDGHKLTDEPGMQKALKDYSKLIEPWATRQSAKMLEKVSTSNRKSYKKKAKSLGTKLRLELTESDVGDVAFALMTEQVSLIKSIPLRAGLRAQELAREAVLNGTRASEIAEELQRTTQVSESTANLIARTEVAKANASFTEARALNVGATHYEWVATMDEATRPSHKKMNGKICDYANPPEVEKGKHYNPGEIYNCRCYASPILPED